MNRLDLSVKYMKGEGIEIGAFQFPWPMANGSKVTYVDKATPGTLIEAHPGLDLSRPIIKADVFDDGESLSKFEACTQDFIIASHMLEHCESPVAAFYNWCDVLKPGGYLFLAVPNKEATFDRDRELTTMEDFNHIRYQKTVLGAKEWREFMVERHHEYLQVVDKIMDPEERKRIANERLDKGFDIHYSVWNVQSFLDFLVEYGVSFFKIEQFSSEGHEMLAVLRKVA